MKASQKTIIIATRGSALALAQANAILAQCQAGFPDRTFQIEIFKTTGDKLQAAVPKDIPQSLPKGLFTKELEAAILDRQAHLAVHSLKDLPTELPGGLVLAAVSEREDVREVMIHAKSDSSTDSRPVLSTLRSGASVATSSPRRKAQLLLLRPDLRIIDIRGNVPTRLRKLKEQRDLDAIVLAAAGLHRLSYRIAGNDALEGAEIPAGLRAEFIPTDQMLPCVGQGAIGIEIRKGDGLLEQICSKLNHSETSCCVRAERAFLQGMGGGCQAPVAALAEIDGEQLSLRAVSFQDGPQRSAEAKGKKDDPASLGSVVAEMIKG